MKKNLALFLILYKRGNNGILPGVLRDQHGSASLYKGSNSQLVVIGYILFSGRTQQQSQDYLQAIFDLT